MSTIPPIQVTNSLTCPHGLPPGACPICNGGGTGATQRQEPVKSQKNDEWTYMQCLIAGRMMRAEEASKLESKQMFEGQLAFLRQLSQNLSDFISRTQNILNRIEENLPPHLQKAFSAFAKNVLTPLLNLLDKLPKIIGEIEKFVADLRNKIVDVAEKLNAIFGEMKNFIDRKLVRNFKKLVKKFLGLFIFTEDEENRPNEEDFEIFKSSELKKVISMLKSIRKKEDDKSDPQAAKSA